MRANHGDDVREHVPRHHLIHRRQVGKTRSTNLHAIGLIRTVRDHIATELALGVFDGGVGLALRYAIAFGKQLEVMDQGLHVVFHLDALGRRNLVIVQDHRAWVLP